MYDEEGSDQGPRGTFETYKAEGDNLYKQGEYKKAIESYNTALELTGENLDKNCLVARSKCYLQLGDTEKALNDAEQSLSEEKEFHKGLFQKAEVLYCMGDFEMALVFYHRGHKIRPELQEFRLGIQKAQEAIDNSVGSPSKVRLTKDGDLSFFAKQDEKVKPKKYGTYSKPVAQKEKQKELPKSAGSEKTVKQLLGELYKDKDYLEKLLKDFDMNTKIGQDASDCLNYLNSRIEFWRQQKPIYARKKEQMEKSKGRTGTKGGPSNNNQYVINELEKIDEALAQGKYEESLKMSEKLLKKVDSWTDDMIQDRESVVANLQSAMGNAYLEMAQYENALAAHQKDLDIANKLDDEDGKSRALDNLGRVYARCGKYQNAVDVWEEKLPLSKSALESTWLFHEIGRCHLEMGKFTEAKDYGEKSMAAAEEAKDNVWKLNASVLIAQADVKLGDYQAATESFERSLEMAKVQGDTAAETAIKKALEDVNERIVKGLKGDDEEGYGGGEEKTHEEKEAPEETEETKETEEKTERVEEEVKDETETKEAEEKEEGTYD